MPLVPVVLGALVALGAPVVLGGLVVWASAPMGDMAKPNAAANPRRGRIFRREPIFDSTPEVIFNLLDFSSLVILVRHLFTTLIRPEQATRGGLHGIAAYHASARSAASQVAVVVLSAAAVPQVAVPARMYLSPFWFA
jgi:hypothetical protein